MGRSRPSGARETRKRTHRNTSRTQHGGSSEHPLHGEETSTSAATIRITLRDPQTGDPISLDGSPPSPIEDDGPAGTLQLNGEPVELNYTGETTVTVTEPGLYTVEFEPASWRTTSPAYVAASESVRWHPLGTVGGWLQLGETLLWGAIPLLAAWIAGRQLGNFLSSDLGP